MLQLKILFGYTYTLYIFNIVHKLRNNNYHGSVEEDAGIFMLENLIFCADIVFIFY